MQVKSISKNKLKKNIKQFEFQIVKKLREIYSKKKIDRLKKIKREIVKETNLQRWNT